MFYRTLSLGLLFAFALGTIVRADPPPVSIEQQAELVAAGIMVRVFVNCGDGATEGELQVAARQGDSTGANADTFPADGTRQQVFIFVPGVFAPGEASASATLVCGLLIQGLDLGATIKIS